MGRYRDILYQLLSDVRYRVGIEISSISCYLMSGLGGGGGGDGPGSEIYGTQAQSQRSIKRETSQKQTPSIGAVSRYII